MEDKTAKLIDNHPDKLVEFIKIKVDDILLTYWNEFNIRCDDDTRIDVILHTYSFLKKKYLNDKNFDSKKNKIVKHIILNYLFKVDLYNQK